LHSSLEKKEQGAMYQYHHFYGPPTIFQLIFWGLSNLFWIGLIGVLAWSALRSFRSQDRRSLGAPADEPSALEVLRRRYVVGEIDVSTFEEMLQELLESEEHERVYRIPPPNTL